MTEVDHRSPSVLVIHASAMPINSRLGGRGAAASTDPGRNSHHQTQYQCFQGSPGSSPSLGSLSPIGGGSSLASLGSVELIPGSAWPSSAYASLTSLDFGSIGSVGSVGYV
jgi:hypothetical protein